MPTERKVSEVPIVLALDFKDVHFEMTPGLADSSFSSESLSSTFSLCLRVGGGTILPTPTRTWHTVAPAPATLDLSHRHGGDAEELTPLHELTRRRRTDPAWAVEWSHHGGANGFHRHGHDGGSSDSSMGCRMVAPWNNRHQQSDVQYARRQSPSAV